MNRIVVAPDSFKGSLSACEVAEAISQGILSVCPSCKVVRVPVADGGEGLVDALTVSMGGRRAFATVSDPLGRPVAAEYGIVGDLAVIEVAAACGLTLLSESERNPLLTTTRGVGELILDAVSQGCRRFLIGLGGSATNDGGRGMLAVPGILERTAGMAFRIACDVNTPFVGAEGASRVFAPQKGASAQDVEVLEARMQEWACVMEERTGVDVRQMPGAGAAGGLGGAFAAFWGARLEPGIELVLDTLRFDAMLEGTDLVITGEGKADFQTMRGKVASGVLRRAQAAGVPVDLLAGKVESCPALDGAGFRRIVQVTPPGMPLEWAMRREIAQKNLRRAAGEMYIIKL